MNRAHGADGPIAFFACCNDDVPAAPAPAPPSGLSRSLWTPGWRAVRPTGLTGITWVVWWSFHQLRVFGNRDYGVLLVNDAGGRVVHRACVFPPYPRFPFMAPDDLQIGDLWTAEEWRGHGLATASLGHIVQQKVRPGRRLWYLAEQSNTASIRVAERAGFRCVGTGRREGRWGLRPLGAYRLVPDGA